MLPSPTLSFTIPSIHDDLIIECRIYHPRSLDPLSTDPIEWRKRGAIVAHPYAPLGGCYDDPVVGLVASTILKQGFVVGTFNFRGAGSSKGRTSWMGKGERSDYISFIGFMSTGISPAYSSPHCEHPLLLLAGYSYGALITTTLPPIISSILVPFQTPVEGSAHAEIRLRATHLASQQNTILQSQLQNRLMSPVRGRRHPADEQYLTSPKIRTSNGVRVGGDEDIRRVSHDSHRSRSSFVLETPERVRRSVDRMRHKTRRTAGSLSLDTSARASESDIAVDDSSSPPQNIVEAIPGLGENLHIAYLLVSPLQGFISTLATMGSLGLGRHSASLTEMEMKLVVDPTLAVYGDDDIFVSAKRLRYWVERLSGATASENKFRHREVPSAGHFWHNAGAIELLREEVRDFVACL